MTIARRALAASLLLAGIAGAEPVAAQDDALEVSANAAIVSEYRFRGVDRSGGNIAVEGGVDIGHASGVFAGAWASTLDADTTGIGSGELDIYAGWSGPIAPTITLTIGTIAYLYPDAPRGDVNYGEVYSAARLALGPGELTLGAAYAPRQAALGDGDNLYLYGDLDVGIPGTPVRLAGRLGYTDGFWTFTDDGTALDWSLGAEVAAGRSLTLGAAYVGAQGDHAPGTYWFTDDALVVTLGANF